MARQAAGNRQIVRDFGTCLNFNGTSAYVVGANTSNIALATLSVWVNIPKKPSATSMIAGFINGLNNVVNDKNIVIDSAGKVFFHVYDGAAKDTSTSATSIPLNRWVHLVAVANGTNAYMYVNGVQVGTIAAGNTYTGYNTANIFCGGRANNGTYTWLKMLADDFRVYNRALSPTEITNLYNGIEPSSTGLITWWKLNEGSGSSATDFSSSNNTGTITAATYSTDVFMKPRTTAGTRTLIT